MSDVEEGEIPDEEEGEIVVKEQVSISRPGLGQLGCQTWRRSRLYPVPRRKAAGQESLRAPSPHQWAHPASACAVHAALMLTVP